MEATERVIAAAKELKKSLMRHLFTYGPVPVSERDRVRLKETEIGPIPEDWEVVRLGEVSLRMFSGGTPSTKIDDYWNGKIPWTTTAIIKENDLYLNNYQKTITEKGLKNSSAKIASKGSVLIGTRVGVGKAVIANFDVAINQDLTAVIIDRKKVNSEFLIYYLKQANIQNWFEEHKRGATIKGIPRKDLERLFIPLPPLPIQQKIAQILKAVDEKIETEEKKKEALQALFKTMLHHLMTGKIRVKY